MVEGRTGSASSGARIHLTGYEGDEEEFQFDHDGSKPASNGLLNNSHAGVSQVLLASFEREVPQPLPPANHRRGPRTESSDHGYSTMTGNCDDSEQATVVGELITPKNRPSSSSKFGVPFGTKRHSFGMVPNDRLDGSGSQTKLLLKDGKYSPSKLGSEAALSVNNTTATLSAADLTLTSSDVDGLTEKTLTALDYSSKTLPPPGQTDLNTSSFMEGEPESNTVTIKAQVHAIDTQG